MKRYRLTYLPGTVPTRILRARTERLAWKKSRTLCTLCQDDLKRGYYEVDHLKDEEIAIDHIYVNHPADTMCGASWEIRVLKSPRRKKGRRS
jgi:hypothetical protein